MATAAKDVRKLPPENSEIDSKRPRNRRKISAQVDPLRIQIARALDIAAIPQLPPLFPGLPNKTDFRKLAHDLNLTVKRPVDQDATENDSGQELLVPGHYTRYQTDEVIAHWAATQAVDHIPAIGEIIGTSNRDEQVDLLAAALFIDKVQLDEFVEKATLAGKNELLDDFSLSSLFSAPERFIALRR